MRFRSNIILNIPQYYFYTAAISLQQNIVRVVHLEVVQGGLLNTLIPNTCLQQPMSGESGLPPRYIHANKYLHLCYCFDRPSDPGIKKINPTNGRIISRIISNAFLYFCVNYLTYAQENISIG